MLKSCTKFSLVIICFIFFLNLPQLVYAQWPPIRYLRNAEYNEKDNTITYYIQFSERVDWLMTDVTINIPLPEGTKLVDTFTYPKGEFSFNGSEVTYFMDVAERIQYRDAYFVVEVIDPERTIFSDQAWISWSGDEPGTYLTQTKFFDIENVPLENQDASGRRRLELQMNAEVDAHTNLMTYNIFFRNTGDTDRIRMQDVRISAPLPDGTEFISANAPSQIATSFDGKEITFFILEVPRKTDMGHLQFQVSTEGVDEDYISTHSWATWKNVGRRVVTSVPAQEDLRTSDLVVRPHVNEWVFSDPIYDVPVSSYDVKNLVLEQTEDGLEVIFYTVEPFNRVDRLYEFVVYIDSDCDASTGEYRFGRGAEYYVMYKYLYSAENQKVYVRAWDDATQTWQKIPVNKTGASMGVNSVTMLLPDEVLVNNRFCWITESGDKSRSVSKRLPIDNVLGEIILSNPLPSVGTASTAHINSTENGTFVGSGSLWRFLPSWSEPPQSWNTLEFNDNDWFSGRAGIGYGTKDIATDVSLLTPPLPDDFASLVGQKAVTQTGVVLAVLPSATNQTVYMRQNFTVVDPSRLSQLSLDINYVGGFAAYLNGIEIARQNLGEPGTPIFVEQLADTQSLNVRQETINLTDYLTTLVPGTNVLAIEGHKPSTSDRLLLDPKLTWTFDPSVLNNSENDTRYLPENLAATTAATSTANSTEIAGKLAIPIMNKYQTDYDVHIFALPDGEEITNIPNARQPNFHPDGQRLLLNREGDGVENVFEHTLATEAERQVSDSPTDWHPFYDPWGNRVVYGNDQLALSGIPVRKVEDGEVQHHDKTGRVIFTGVQAPFIYLQCSLQPPHLEADAHCRDVAVFGILVPAGQMGDLRGTNPVWTSDDYIVYKGCNTWAGSASCGIYKVPSASTKALSDGFIPRQLTKFTSDTPSDTKGNWIAFSSQRDGDWEAYLVDLNGGNLRNLSNSPSSNDGLPAISPDQKWAAFVSDRDGQWAIWIVPLEGGVSHKAFDLPTNTPWGAGEQSWLTERISWSK